MKLNFTSLFLFIFIMADGQVLNSLSDFNLSDYKMPEINNHLLDANISFIQTNTINDRMGANNGAVESSNFHGNLSLQYRGFTNNAIWQKRISIYSESTYLKFDQYHNNNVSKRSNFASDFDIQTTFRKYFNSNHFFEIDHRLVAKLRRAKTFTESGGFTNEQKDKGFNANLYLPIKFGKGRIENVTDARHAVFILDALKKKQALKKDLSSTEIIEFAALISKLKNKRFFDTRLRRIAEMGALDTFLRSKNHVDPSGMQYFTTLNDMWLFGGERNRKAGHRLSFAVYPGVLYSKTGDGNFVDIFDAEAYDIHAGLEFKHEKPINIRFQNSFSAYSYLGILVGGYGDDFYIPQYTVNIPKFNIGFTNVIGFYPNTRTSIEYTFGVQYDSYVNKIDKQNDVVGLDGERFFLTSAIDLNYFISPRFSISVYTFTNFSTFFTNKTNFILEENILQFSNYPNCQNRSCDLYLQSRKRFQYHFNLSMTYNLF